MTDPLSHRRGLGPPRTGFGPVLGERRAVAQKCAATAWAIAVTSAPSLGDLVPGAGDGTSSPRLATTSMTTAFAPVRISWTSDDRRTRPWSHVDTHAVRFAPTAWHEGALLSMALGAAARLARRRAVLGGPRRSVVSSARRSVLCSGRCCHRRLHSVQAGASVRVFRHLALQGLKSARVHGGRCRRRITELVGFGQFAGQLAPALNLDLQGAGGHGQREPRVDPPRAVGKRQTVHGMVCHRLDAGGKGCGDHCSPVDGWWRSAGDAGWLLGIKRWTWLRAMPAVLSSVPPSSHRLRPRPRTARCRRIPARSAPSPRRR